MKEYAHLLYISPGPGRLPIARSLRLALVAIRHQGASGNARGAAHPERGSAANGKT